MSAIQIAEELTRAGIDAVPIFWMATEDHDLDEVRVSTMVSRRGKLTRFELHQGNGDAGLPVGRIALGPQVSEMVDEAARILTAAGGEFVAGIFRESYGVRETYGSAFGKLFARLFAEQGLILLDPLDARLHRVAGEVLRRAVEERDELNEALLARGKELDKAGFAAQVKVTARSTLLFSMGQHKTGAHGGTRQPIAVSGEKFVCGEQSWTKEDLVRAVQAEPEKFSPNALLRPVLQDFLFCRRRHVHSWVEAEIAYFARAEVIYKKLLGRMPVILPRAAYTILDAKAEKLLRRYGLKVEDVWRGAQELRRKMETASVPPTLGKTFDKTVKESARMLAQLKKQIVRLDATLRRRSGRDGAEEDRVPTRKIKAQGGQSAGAEGWTDCRASGVSRIAALTAQDFSIARIVIIAVPEEMGYGRAKGASEALRQRQNERAQDSAHSLR